MIRVAFAGSFAARIAEPVRARLSLPCEVMIDDEANIVPRLGDVDVLVSMGFSARMAAAAPPLWPKLAGKTLGVLGFGHIGQALARRATAFDMQVCAVRRRAPTKTPSGLLFLGGPERVDDVMRLADYLAVTLSLSPETRNLIDDCRMQLMKPTAFLINVARAEIFDERALYRALASGRLAGAALDVWYRYPTTAEPTPPAAQPFHELHNVLMTPHVSGWTAGMLDARANLIAHNIERTARGVLPLNLVSLALT